MVKIIRNERFHLTLSIVLFLAVLHGVYFGNTIAFATNCTSYVTHTFSFTGYYYQTSWASFTSMTAAMDDGEALTLGIGDRFPDYEDDFVECCVSFSRSGDIHQEEDQNLILINTASEIEDALDAAEANRVSDEADHGVFFCWTLDGGGFKGGVTRTGSGTDGEITFPDIYSDSIPDSVFIVQLSGANGLSTDLAFAHEHGHLHGLEHNYLNNGYDLTLDNIMSGGGEYVVVERVGLFEWQCDSDQWTNPNHDYDLLGYSEEP